MTLAVIKRPIAVIKSSGNPAELRRLLTRTTEEADRATTQVALATDQRLGAEAARDIAALAAATAPQVYEDTATGLAAVAEGETFWVETDGNLLLYREESGAAVLKTTALTNVSGLDNPNIATGFNIPTAFDDTMFGAQLTSVGGYGDHINNEQWRIGYNIVAAPYRYLNPAEPQFYYGVEKLFEGRMEVYARFHLAGEQNVNGIDDRLTGYAQAYQFLWNRTTGFVDVWNIRGEQINFQTTDKDSYLTMTSDGAGVAQSVSVDCPLLNAREANFSEFAYTNNNVWFGSRRSDGIPSAMMVAGTDNQLYFGDINGGFGESVHMRWNGQNVVSIIGGATYIINTLFCENNLVASGDITTNGALLAATQVNVAGNKVLGPRQPAIADATDAASAITQLNAALAALREHGLIAT